MIRDSLQYNLPIRLDHQNPTLEACFARVLSNRLDYSVLSIVIPENVEPEIAQWWLDLIYPEVNHIWVEEYADCVSHVEALKIDFYPWIPAHLRGALNWHQFTTSVQEYSGQVIAATGCLLRHIKEQPEMLTHMFRNYGHVTDKAKLWKIFMCYECGLSSSLGFTFTGHKFVSPYYTTITKIPSLKQVMKELMTKFPEPWYKQKYKTYSGSTSVIKELCGMQFSHHLGTDDWKRKIDEIIDGD